MKHIINILTEIITNYVESGKKADEAFFNEIYNVMYATINDENYLRNFVLIPKDKMLDPKYSEYTKGLAGIFGQAAYHKIKKELIVYMRNITYEANMQLEGLVIEEKEYIALYNLIILQVLLHEFEHIKQHIMMDKGEDYESALLRATDNKGKDTNDTYEYNLHERLAQLRSYETIMHISTNLGLDNTVYTYFEELYNKELISGYGKINKAGYIERDIEGAADLSIEGMFVSPTSYYVSKSNCDTTAYLELCDEVLDKDRLVYGLPMELEEYLLYRDIHTPKL